MAEYEIILTGDDILARLNALCAIEPGVYGKRWNPDGSLAVLVRAVADGHDRSAQELTGALDAPDLSQADQKTAEPPKSRSPRRPEPEAPEIPAEPEA